MVAWLRGAGALAQGLVGGCALAGAGLAVALVPRLDGALGWRAPFVPELALAAAAAGLAALAPPGRPSPARRDTSLRELLRHPLVWRYGAMASFSFGASFAVGAWIVPLFTQSDGFSAQAGALAGSLVLFGGILTRPLGGALVRDRPGLARPLMVGSIAVGAAAVLLLAADVGALASTAAALVVGLAAGLPYGATTAGAMAAFPGEPGRGGGRDDRAVGLLRGGGRLPAGAGVRRRRGPPRLRDPGGGPARAAPGGAAAPARRLRA